MTTPLLTIEIPSEYLALAPDWYYGQGDMLYALASTGDLTLGSIRPRDDEGDPMSDEAWHVHLWSCLSSDVYEAVKAARKSGHDDADSLEAFETFCDETADMLRSHYGLR